jgi:hypothetical protein
MTPELKKAIESLRAAVENEGPAPAYHRAVVGETEKNWPTLMKAVRAILKASK